MPAEGKIVNKEVVFRLYGTEIKRLKSVVKRIATIKGLSPEIYGADEEFLINVKLFCEGEAAGDMLVQQVVDLLEKEIGEEFYGRDRQSLAHIACAELILKEAQIVCADRELGEALEDEFNTTKRGTQVFDYGEDTYKNSRVWPIYPSEKIIYKYGEDSLQAASDAAFKAMRKAKAKLGCAITAPDEDGRCWVAVTYAGKVYARQLPPDASKRAAALAVLDIARRICAKIDLVSGTRKFAKGNINTDKREKKGGALAITIVILLIFGIAIALGIFYYINTYTIPNINA